MDSASLADAEEKAIKLIVAGEKAMVAIRKCGLYYKSRSPEYRRIFRKAGIFFTVQFA